VHVLRGFGDVQPGKLRRQKIAGLLKRGEELQIHPPIQRRRIQSRLRALDGEE